MELLHLSRIYYLSILSSLEFCNSEEYDKVTGFLLNKLLSSKKALKGEAVIEKISNAILRVLVYVHTQTKRKYVSRVALIPAFEP